MQDMFCIQENPFRGIKDRRLVGNLERQTSFYRQWAYLSVWVIHLFIHSTTTAENLTDVRSFGRL